MLSTLRIKNLALVPDLALELQPGYNAITGETGAGKSVIIGALKLVLGERADRSQIRSGADNCSVEAVFSLDKLQTRINAFLQEKGLEQCEEGQLVLKRVFTAAGANKQFVNGSPATLSTLAAIGEWLVDMHGPHEHQSLLHSTRQLAILDAYGDLQSLRDKFAEIVRRHSDLIAARTALVIDERTYAQQLDLLRFQASEIAGAKLIPDEEEQLESEYNRVSNAARLIELSQSALAALGENDASLLDSAGAIGRSLQELTRLDSAVSSILDLHEQAVSLLQDLQRELSQYADQVQVDPARLQELGARLDLIKTLKRKYGGSVAEVIAFGNEAKRKLESLESRDVELARINAELSGLEKILHQTGLELTAARRKVVPKLSRAAVKHLADLGFKQSSFEVQIVVRSSDEAITDQISSTGFDQVEFQFAPNPGEPSRPLKAIASSGELARVMLALKTALAAEDEVPVLVFDEVDANVGGETAVAVGRKMKQIGTQRQVLCISHLAQVAAAANAHFVVTKELREGRTISMIEPVSGDSRVAELARMLGGGGAARKHAEALLEQG